MSNDQERIELLYGNDSTYVTGVEPAEDNAPSTIEENFGYALTEDKSVGNPYSLEPDSIEDSLYGAESKVTLSDETDLTQIYSSTEEQLALRENLGVTLP